MLNCTACGGAYEPYGQRKCRPCYNEYMRMYMLDRYHRRREEYIESQGRVCARCNAPGPEFEIDHVDEPDKSAAISTLLTSGSKKKLQVELAKCQLLCKDCHRKKTRKYLAKTWGQRELWEHGTLAGYRYCRCARCKKAKSDYARDYRERKLNKPL